MICFTAAEGALGPERRDIDKSLLTLGAATATRVWQPGVSRLFSASCLDKHLPTAPMDQMPRFLLGLMLAF